MAVLMANENRVVSSYLGRNAWHTPKTFSRNDSGTIDPALYSLVSDKRPAKLSFLYAKTLRMPQV